uniref:Phosphotransferase n=1 Tax=Timema tahoe TaxID=61484 RepID=A0A7R9FFB2_9NEOP|nr:unnamed protein product [Timema tahoe]
MTGIWIRYEVAKKKIILEKTLKRARSIPRRDVTPVEWLQAIGSRLPWQPIESRLLVGSSLPLPQTFALTLSSPWCSEGSVRGKPQAASSLHTYHVFVRVATSLASKPLSYNLQANCLQYKQGLSEIREECQELVLSDGQVLEIMKRLLTELNRGLSKATHDTADVKCFTTFVQDLPNGTVCHVSWQLFDHIAECLANFMIEHDLSSERLPLGFTFSFPLSQRGLTKGYLVQWTKGFDCSDCINEDVVQMLKDAIARRNDVKIDVCAILNDTTGTLMSCAWKNFNCRIGIIVGTGSNACYVEKVENLELFEGDKSKPYMVINTEWGAFGDNGALEIVRTQYDREIDSHSINAGKQLHEKMISGMYMGELVRLVLVKFTKSNLLFGGKGSDMLFERGTFFTKFVSEIESDKRGTFTGCRQVLDELGLSHATDQDCVNVRYVCECVSRRAAHLVSAGVATLINKMGQLSVTVGVDGSVYRFHPYFHDLMVEKISELVTPGIKFDLMLSEDGSGRGAALVAAVACRDR